MSRSDRLAHVSSVLGRVFLSEAAYSVGLRRERSGDDFVDHDRQRALMVRHALEQLGPFYIKVGQMLSTRPDLVSDSMIKEFEKLHDHVSVAKFELFEPVLEAELGRNWRRYFKSIDYTVLGAASLAQVYHVTLATGEPAVIKVQRPGIVPVMLDDMALTRRAAKLVAKRAPDFNDVMDIEAILELIFDAMRAELDFRVEAENMDDARHSVRDFEKLAVPEVVFATEKVLVQTMAPGTTIRAVNRDEFKRKEREEIGRELLTFMYEGYFTERVFHADPHPGNIFVEPGGKAYIIDWGMVGRLDRPTSMAVAMVILHLAENDGAGLAKAWIELGRATSWANIPGFVNDMCGFVPTVANASLEKFNFGSTINRVLRYASRRGIQTTPMIGLLGKSFANIEGSVRYLAPELSITEVFEDAFRDILFDLAQETLSEQQAARIVLEGLMALNALPEQARTVARDLANRELTVQFNEVQSRSSRRESRADARARATRRTIAGVAVAALWLEHRRRSNGMSGAPPFGR
jgi:ubiquinone biosynthesis protein